MKKCPICKTGFVDEHDIHRTQTTIDDLRSKCCGRPVEVSEADEGTCCYICLACGKPCDTE